MRSVLVAAALLGMAGSALAIAESEVKAGAYCPLPEGDAPPECLNPAQEDYEAFFSGLRRGHLEEGDLTELEGDLAGDERYQALSALVYGYYVLSRRAVPGAPTDPELARRLERWNDLIRDTYQGSDDAAFREAVRAAVEDLRVRAPAVPVRCTDAEGRTVPCQSTDAVARAISDVRDRTGLRGAVGRLIQRLFGGGDGGG